MAQLTGDPVLDLLIVVAFVLAAVALVRGKTERSGGVRGWNALRADRKAELDARRGIEPAPYDPDDVVDFAPLARLARRRAILGAVVFVVMLGCLAVLGVWRLMQG